MTTSKALELITLGGVRLIQSDAEAKGRLGPRHLALLVYLFHEQRPMQPAELVEVLGRGREEEKELEALWKNISWIRKCAPSINIQMTSETIEGISGVRLDTTDVDAAIDRGDAGLVKSHYVGEFLEGFESGATGFDDWAQRERTRIQRAWGQVIAAAARKCENRGQWPDAAEWWGVLAERSPGQLETALGLIRTCAKAGRIEEAGRGLANYMASLEARGIKEPAPAVKKLVGAYPEVLNHAGEWKRKLEKLSAQNGAAVKVDAGSTAAGPEPGEKKGERPADRIRGLESGAGLPGSDTVMDLDLEVEELVDLDRTHLDVEPGAIAPEAIDAGDDAIGVNPDLLEMWDQMSVPTGPQATASTNGESRGVDAEPTRGRGGRTPDGGRLEFMLPDGRTETVDETDVPPTRSARKRAHDPELLNLARATLEHEKERKIAHQVTSVRKPWGPFLRRVWDELEPWRELIARASIAALVGIARALTIVARFLGLVGVAVLLGLGRAVRGLGSGLAWSGSGAVGLGRGTLRLLGALAVGVVNGVLFVPRTIASRLAGRRVTRVKAKAERQALRQAELEAARARAQAEREALRRAEAERQRRETEARQRQEVEQKQRREDAARQRQEAEQRQRLEAERRERQARSETKRDVGPRPTPGPLRPGEPHARETEVPRGARAPVEDDDEFLSLVPGPEEQSEPLVPLPDEFLDERELGGSTEHWSPTRWDAAKPRVESTAPGRRVSIVRDREKSRRTRRLGVGLAAFGSIFKRRWFAPVGLGASGLAVVLALVLTDVIGGVEDSVSSNLPDLRPPALPRVSLPKVSVPKVTIKTPDFVENPLSKLGGLFSGPILTESGRRVVLADVEAEAGQTELASALTMALEADLWESRYFSMVPRERALAILRNQPDEGGDDSARRPGSLSTADALKVAGAAGYAAVVTGRLTRSGEKDSLRLHILDPSGAEKYGLAAEIEDDLTVLETLGGLTRELERRLGEPSALIEASHPGAQLLSTSTEALTRYAEARTHLFHGRYDEAAGAARNAIASDSAFAIAYIALAEAEALRGRRTRARAALERAWDLSSRISEREQLRLLGDRLAWDGLYTEAALTYDKLFKLYRDDASALRSLAIVQRMLGARGGGEGNLRVAYEIDPYDWPSLGRLARYLGYRGPLPDVDSLVASLEETPNAAAPRNSPQE